MHHYVFVCVVSLCVWLQTIKPGLHERAVQWTMYVLYTGVRYTHVFVLSWYVALTVVYITLSFSHSFSIQVKTVNCTFLLNFIIFFFTLYIDIYCWKMHYSGQLI